MAEFADGITEVQRVALDVVVAVLYLLFAFMVRSGRNWARLTITGIVGKTPE